MKAGWRSPQVSAGCTGPVVSLYRGVYPCVGVGVGLGVGLGRQA